MKIQNCDVVLSARMRSCATVSLALALSLLLILSLLNSRDNFESKSETDSLSRRHGDSEPSGSLPFREKESESEFLLLDDDVEGLPDVRRISETKSKEEFQLNSKKIDKNELDRREKHFQIGSDFKRRQMEMMRRQRSHLMRITDVFRTF